MNKEELLRLKKGDIIYEFAYGSYIEAEIVTNPVVRDTSISWIARNTLNDELITYRLTLESGVMHYNPKLYTHMEYIGFKQI